MTRNLSPRHSRTIKTKHHRDVVAGESHKYHRYTNSFVNVTASILLERNRTEHIFRDLYVVRRHTIQYIQLWTKYKLIRKTLTYIAYWQHFYWLKMKHTYIFISNDYLFFILKICYMTYQWYCCIQHSVVQREKWMPFELNKPK